MVHFFVVRFCLNFKNACTCQKKVVPLQRNSKTENELPARSVTGNAGERPVRNTAGKTHTDRECSGGIREGTRFFRLRVLSYFSAEKYHNPN